jgi:hypothetical protein
LLSGAALGQTPAQTAAPASAAPVAAQKPKVSSTHKKKVQATALQSIPLETAPPSPPTPPAAQAQQKAADQRLLEQQQAQSAQAAQITNRQVQQAQKQKDAIQNEVRIQDAPGPAQTGVVPAAGPPVAPVNANDRIQDAPGPAQTLPPMPSTTPSQLPAPPTQPVSPPPQ